MFNPEVLVDIVPDPELVLRMGPEDLGIILLRIARSAYQNEAFHPSCVNGAGRNGFGSPPDAKRYPRQLEGSIQQAVNEGWAWLKNQLLVVQAEGTNGQNGWMTFGRRATEVLAARNLDGFRAASDFPKALLHPKIADKVWLSLARNELEDAVFAAAKAVEIAVRQAGRYAPDDIGMPLMRKAFSAENGPLTDMNAARGERVAMMELFAGAIGTLKNPGSHRDVPLKLGEAREMVMTASLLLRIVDARAP